MYIYFFLAEHIKIMILNVWRIFIYLNEIHKYNLNILATYLMYSVYSTVLFTHCIQLCLLSPLWKCVHISTGKKEILLSGTFNLFCIIPPCEVYNVDKSKHQQPLAYWLIDIKIELEKIKINSQTCFGLIGHHQCLCTLHWLSKLENFSGWHKWLN